MNIYIHTHILTYSTDTHTHSIIKLHLIKFNILTVFEREAQIKFQVKILVSALSQFCGKLVKKMHNLCKVNLQHALMLSATTLHNSRDINMCTRQNSLCKSCFVLHAVIRETLL